MKLQKMSRRTFLAALSCATGAVAIGDTVTSLSHRITPRGIIIHHSALPGEESIATIETIHRNSGLASFYWYRCYNIGYHYIVRSSGEVIACRPERLRGSHAKGSNDFIGICVHGNFDSATGSDFLEGAQLEATRKLCIMLLVKYSLRVNDIYKHSQVDLYTRCPGDRFPFDRLLESVRTANHGGIQ